MIVLVRAGDKYAPEYVTALLNQLPGEEVVTLTDQKDTPGLALPLLYDLPGWWAKMELFAPENRDLRPFLYIDLDSFVFGPVDKYRNGEKFTMVEDFNGWTPANSCIMWVPEDVNHIWTEFITDPDRAMRAAGNRGDQQFLGVFAEHLWKTPEDGITSYKSHGRGGPSGTVMQFHGHPKPHEIRDGWVAEYWKRHTTS